ncbi:unnamed protein product [Lactuca virosa]|uniref:Uncharacterized protein n=1 Tax=Lactuca virosa TaxID=75947 RepID=A0AAU9NJJ5_9ASTR|nr:unnamed protein product [Lactuca virosa]
MLKLQISEEIFTRTYKAMGCGGGVHCRVLMPNCNFKTHLNKKIRDASYFVHWFSLSPLKISVPLESTFPFSTSSLPGLHSGRCHHPLNHLRLAPSSSHSSATPGDSPSTPIIRLLTAPPPPSSTSHAHQVFELLDSKTSRLCVFWSPFDDFRKWIALQSSLIAENCCQKFETRLNCSSTFIRKEGVMASSDDGYADPFAGIHEPFAGLSEMDFELHGIYMDHEPEEEFVSSLDKYEIRAQVYHATDWQSDEDEQEVLKNNYRIHDPTIKWDKMINIKFVAIC